jgi:glycosyltransferase involved in cell wall biosynthesis
MVTNKPSIDVIIPVYNGKNFIERAISSVLKQTYLPSRILVIDDGSTDGTADILRKIKADLDQMGGPSLKLLQGNHSGPSAARNIGIKEISADYVAFLDADDEWLSNKLEKQINLFTNSSHNNLGMVYCKTIVCEYGLDGSIKSEQASDPKQMLRGDIFEILLKTNYEIRSPSLFILPSNVIKDIGLFDETLKSAEDWDYSIRVSQKYSIDYVDEYLVKMWNEPNSNTKSNWRMLKGFIRLYKKWEKYYSDEIKNDLANRVGYYLFGLPFMPKMPKNRKSVIGKIRKIVSKPILVDLLYKFI